MSGYVCQCHVACSDNHYLCVSHVCMHEAVCACLVMCASVMCIQ